jgi:hypothetical protein
VGVVEPVFAPICCNGGPTRESPRATQFKVILPYEPGYTGHWEMEKRRKETKEWLRQREQEVKRSYQLGIYRAGSRDVRHDQAIGHPRLEVLELHIAGKPLRIG